MCALCHVFWELWTVVLEKTLESPLDHKEIKPVNPKGNQPWIFNERTDAKAEALILWPPDAKSQLIVKDPDAGKDWGQEEKGKTENEMVGWYHQLSWHEFEQILRVMKEREAWHAAVRRVKELDTNERLNNYYMTDTDLISKWEMSHSLMELTF